MQGPLGLYLVNRVNKQGLWEQAMEHEKDVVPPPQPQKDVIGLSERFCSWQGTETHY